MKRAAAALVLLAACSHPAPAAPRASRPAARASASPAPSAPHASTYLVVARQQSNAVRVIPLDGSAGTDLPVGVKTLGAASDGTVAALTAPAAGALVLVTGSPPAARTVTGLASPHDAIFTSGGLVAVTEENRNDLALVDPDAARIVRRVPLPARPHNVVRDGSRLLVTMPNAKQFALVDPSTGDVHVVAVGERPHACEAAGERIWCVTYDAPHVLLVEHDAVTKRLSLGTFPHHLRPMPDGGALIADPNGGHVVRLDASGRTQWTAAVAKAGEMLVDGSQVYAASDAGSVVIVRNGTVTKRWTVPGSPHAVAFAT